ncbi:MULTISPECIES: hypothetical protein [Leptolyngbya]|uniref:hypothetical protein n=1 Tax=Leptolyngbya TaxID=47251 RepID=UPI0016852978|nr:hypothetical protein [Leptolyngbya sp. FACHB-1624]MBD1855135.1 hypothetical protein [Leptolyngbya sp. FACHB-1624]
MKRKLIALIIGAVALIPGTVKAQEYGIPHSMLDSFSDDADSQIVIRVRKPGDRSNLCGRRMGMIDDGYSFPRPGSAANNYDYPRPGGSNYFQLPTGARNPDIIGCVDRSRNILFINIFKVVEQVQPTSEPTPYNPNQMPIYAPKR